ncbi:hypothetical protein MLD38_011344 [Melastoma candidum]|uniref:Uncharacterized protein n=1 Tax=Melastoma candidum TaxID=119954 RepID=A0ACB9R6A1_9MYRT|nr:hypothetical protein MLD38_011344 [Melastoma candidum]
MVPDAWPEDGAFVEAAYEFASRCGIAAKEDYPYQHGVWGPPVWNVVPKAAFIKGYEHVPKNEVDLMRAVAASIASESIKHYMGGVHGRHGVHEACIFSARWGISITQSTLLNMEKSADENTRSFGILLELDGARMDIFYYPRILGWYSFSLWSCQIYFFFVSVASACHPCFLSPCHKWVNVQSGEEVAIKLGAVKTKHPQLHYESKLYMLLQGGTGVPHIKWFGVEGEYNVMVMDLLGPSLKNLFNYYNRKFSLKTVLMLADQLINRVEYMHSRDFLHHDTKPVNFFMALGHKGNQVYIIDYGLAKKYKDLQTHKHIRYRSKFAEKSLLVMCVL